MIYGINDKPPVWISIFIAIQHLLAVFGGIVAAPIIIALGMGLNVEQTSYLVSSSLFISGIATFIQVNRMGPIGSGLLSIQGTSFTFIGPLISAYTFLLAQNTPEQALGILMGTCAACAICVGLLGQFVEYIRKVITPNVTGTTVILIGISLVWTTLQNIFREYTGYTEEFDQAWWILVISAGVFALTFVMSQSKITLVRIMSVTVGLFFGFILATFFGFVDFSKLDGLSTFFVPEINHFPLGFSIGIFAMLLPIFILSSVETIGDLTATSNLSGVKLGSKDYWSRIRAGISGDAFNSTLAALFCTFPNTSFSQNNGVIRLTGVCSRHIGKIVAGMLVVLGLFPIVGAIFIIIPGAVLYGATVLMFFLVLLSGINIVRGYQEDGKKWIVVGFSVVFGLLIARFIPIAEYFPAWIANVLAYPISTGAIIAMLIEGCRLLFSSINSSKSQKIADS